MLAHDNHTFYRALLRLYPKAHRLEYGDQMVQTLDDLLSEHQDVFERMGIWLRIVIELPRNLAEEHISNIRSMNMDVSKSASKKTLGIIVGVIGVVVVAIVGLLVLPHPKQYAPTTLARVPKAATLPTCVRSSDNPNLSVKSDDMTFITNAVATSITDVPAGTTVNAYLNSYSGSSASGTAVYSGKYGHYNFIADKATSNASNNYVGGWKITHLEVCKA